MLHRVISFIEDLPSLPSIGISLGSAFPPAILAFVEAVSPTVGLVAMLMGGVVVPATIVFCKIRRDLREHREHESRMLGREE